MAGVVVDARQSRSSRAMSGCRYGERHAEPDERQRAEARLPAGARRAARRRRAGGDGRALGRAPSRRDRAAAAGRLPRRRRVLRDLGLPDHVAAARRAPGAPGASICVGSGCAGPVACCPPPVSPSPPPAWRPRSSVWRSTARHCGATLWRRSPTSPTGGSSSTDQSYFAAFGVPSPFRHLWSLSLEEQWYLVFPPVLVGLLALGAPADAGRCSSSWRSRPPRRRRGWPSATRRARTRRGRTTAPTRGRRRCWWARPAGAWHGAAGRRSRAGCARVTPVLGVRGAGGARRSCSRSVSGDERRRCYRGGFLGGGAGVARRGGRRWPCPMPPGPAHWLLGAASGRGDRADVVRPLPVALAGVRDH